MRSDLCASNIYVKVIVSDVESDESVSQSFDISTNHLTEMTYFSGHQAAGQGHWHWRHPLAPTPASSVTMYLPHIPCYLALDGS